MDGWNRFGSHEVSVNKINKIRLHIFMNEDNS